MVICGQCNQQFPDEAAELDHVCPETGVKPTDPRSMGSDYEAIQQAALQRGAERVGEDIHPAVAAQPEMQTQPAPVMDQVLE